MSTLNCPHETSSPVFSIVIPVYNREGFLPTCIESVLSQTFSSFEILIIDDASLDSSMAVASAYAHQEIRITALSNPRNLGSQRSRNRGLSLATGKYIIFLDSDDILSPYYLQIAYKAFSLFPRLKLFAVRCVQASVENSDLVSMAELVDDLGPCCEVDLRSYLNKIYSWPTSASSWDKNALLELGGWDESLTLWQDWNLNVRFLASGQSALYCDLPLVVYRLTADGLSRQKHRKIHVPYLRSRVSAWKACCSSEVRISHRDEWLRHFCGAVTICRHERSTLRQLILSAYYSILCWPSLRTLRRIRSAWLAGSSESSSLN
jgi:glycosyltransferase involved in cell wall biosynthesis